MSEFQESLLLTKKSDAKEDNNDWKEKLLQIAYRMQQILNVQKEASELFQKKNTDYGDAFAEYGAIGVIVRIGDKIKRSISISNSSIQVKDETLRDTLLDLHNYSAMAIMLLDEQTKAKKT